MKHLVYRITSKVDIYTPLLSIFQVHYKPEAVAKIEPVLKNIQNFRNELCDVSLLLESSVTIESNIGKIKHYNTVLNSVCQRINFSDLNVEFSWADNIQDNSPLKSNDLNIEKFSMLFNMGVLYMNLAALIGEHSKRYRESGAAYSMAANVFDALRKEIIAKEKTDIGLAFNLQVLQIHISVSKAMGQLYFLQAAIIENDKNVSMLAKGSKCVSELFESANINFKSELVPEIFAKSIPEEYKTTLDFLSKLFSGMANFFMARYYGDDIINPEAHKTSGHALAYINFARSFFMNADATKRAKFAQNLYIELMEYSKKKIDYIESQNFEIFKNKIELNVPKIEAIGLQKESEENNILETDSVIANLFSSLEKIDEFTLKENYKNERLKFRQNVQQKEQKYDEEEHKFIEENALNYILFQINNIKTQYDLPEELYKKIENVHQKGGLSSLLARLMRTQEERRNWKAFIEQGRNYISTEEAKYKQYKEIYNEKWTQKPAENGIYKKLMDDTEKSFKEEYNKIVQYEKMLDKNSEEVNQIMLLEKDLGQIQASIPCSVIFKQKAITPFIQKYFLDF